VAVEDAGALIINVVDLTVAEVTQVCWLLIVEAQYQLLTVKLLTPYTNRMTSSLQCFDAVDRATDRQGIWPVKPH